MKDQEPNIRKYVFFLVLLIVLYYLVSTIPLGERKRDSRQEMVSENIKTLEATTRDLNDLVAKDKEALNDLFFNLKTAEKIRGLITTYPADRELKVNDNLKIILQQEGNPVKIRYKRAEYELINSRFNLTDDTKDKMTITTDVVVVENPNMKNNYELIHELKTYLVDAYGQNALDKFLDDVIAETIDENKKLIDEISLGNN